MTELNTQLICLLGEIKKEITAHRDHYNQKSQEILKNVDFLDIQLRQNLINDEIVHRIGDIDVDKYRLPN